MTGVSTTDKWTAYGENLKKELAKLRNKPYVKVGILEKDYNVKKKLSKTQKTAGGIWPRTVGAVAVYNEFGAPRAGIPERSFIRWTHDQKRDQWTKMTKKLKSIIVAGKMTIKRALGVMGLTIQADIQTRIASNIPPPNAPSTIARKGQGSTSTTTLIDTGQMRTSIHYEVVNAD